MIIKVCGMKDPDNIGMLAKLKPDYMGFIFHPDSARFAGSLVREQLLALNPDIKKTGVFVNAEMDEIADEVIQYDLDAVQLHGDESPEFCRSFRKFIHNMQTEKRVEIIKAFGVSEDFNFALLNEYDDYVDYYLFDTKSAQRGGSGQTFNWDVLRQYNGKKGYFLSGGLSQENIGGAARLKDPRLIGIDLNSRFESAPGMKDIDKLKSAFSLFRNPSEQSYE